jgi:hypothetical protein
MPLLTASSNLPSLDLLLASGGDGEVTTTQKLPLGRAECERLGFPGGFNVSRVQAEVEVVEGGAALSLTSRGTNPTPVWSPSSTAEGGSFTKRLLKRGEKTILRDGDRFGLFAPEEDAGRVAWHGNAWHGMGCYDKTKTPVDDSRHVPCNQSDTPGVPTLAMGNSLLWTSSSVAAASVKRARDDDGDGDEHGATTRADAQEGGGGGGGGSGGPGGGGVIGGSGDESSGEAAAKRRTMMRETDGHNDDRVVTGVATGNTAGGAALRRNEAALMTALGPCAPAPAAAAAAAAHASGSRSGAGGAAEEPYRRLAGVVAEAARTAGGTAGTAAGVGGASDAASVLSDAMAAGAAVRPPTAFAAARAPPPPAPSATYGGGTSQWSELHASLLVRNDPTSLPNARIGRVGTPGGCQIGYVHGPYWLSSTGCVLTHNNNVVKSANPVRRSLRPRRHAAKDQVWQSRVHGAHRGLYVLEPGGGPKAAQAPRGGV